MAEISDEKAADLKPVEQSAKQALSEEAFENSSCAKWGPYAIPTGVVIGIFGHPIVGGLATAGILTLACGKEGKEIYDAMSKKK